MKSKHIIVVSSVSLLLIFGFLFGLMYLQNTNDWFPNSHGISTGTDLGSQEIELPDWNMTLSDSSTVSLHDYRGDFVIIELMATWCGACETQISNLKALQEIRTDGIKIISLSVDISETPTMMADYKTEHDFDWDCGIESQNTFSSYLEVEYIPTIVIIDADGFLRWVEVGSWTANSMDSTLTSLGL